VAEATEAERCATAGGVSAFSKRQHASLGAIPQEAIGLGTGPRRSAADPVLLAHLRAERLVRPRNADAALRASPVREDREPTRSSASSRVGKTTLRARAPQAARADPTEEGKATGSTASPGDVAAQEGGAAAREKKMLVEKLRDLGQPARAPRARDV